MRRLEHIAAGEMVIVSAFAVFGMIGAAVRTPVRMPDPIYQVIIRIPVP